MGTIFDSFARESSFSVQWKRIFQQMLHFRQRKWIFWLLQTISFFSSSGNVFFNESFIPAIGEGFSLQLKPSTLLENSFLLVETVTDMSGNHFLKIYLILAGGNHFLLLSQIFFKEFFIPANRNTFFSPEEKALFFTLNFFSCQWKPFSDTPAIDTFIFVSNGNVLVNKSCILVSQSGISGKCKPLFYLFFRHWKCVFEANPSFQLVELGFLASRNFFFYHFLDTLGS